MNFVEDFKLILIKNLSLFGHTIDPSMSIREVGYIFLNVDSRIPELKKWDVKVSNVISSKLPTFSIEIQNGFNNFVSEAKNGKNLKPFISRQIKNTSYRDMMLYDWGIYHFHLGDTIESDGFINRTNELVFSLIRNDELYLIDILPHKGSFYEQDLLNIVDNEWPNVLSRFVANAIAVSPVMSNEDISKMRRAGIQTSIQLKSRKVLMPPGGGYTTAGTSLKIQMEVSQLVNHLRSIQQFVEEDQSDEIKNHLGVDKNEYSSRTFKLVEYGNPTKVLDVNSKVVFNIPIEG